MAEWIVEAETLQDLENGFYAIGNGGESIVRCKDCKWYREKQGFCVFGRQDLSPNDYCSFGERKDEMEE